MREYEESKLIKQLHRWIIPIIIAVIIITRIAIYQA